MCQFFKKKGENMSQQHQKWVELVKCRINEKGWSQSDLATVTGVTPAAITRLLKEGHGSDSLKLEITKKLSISDSWTVFEER
ncbi:hypothetical protein HMPREF9394_1624 [Streptococcus sanguinis SK1057]|nr:hypothetical protein HMPREF9394_1624 [Streptococcus sanguinis SK1057]